MIRIGDRLDQRRRRVAEPADVEARGNAHRLCHAVGKAERDRLGGVEPGLGIAPKDIVPFTTLEPVIPCTSDSCQESAVAVEDVITATAE